ncbi:MAG: hypothetical protein Q7I94_02320 [Candidatus Contubernalis sp.]|nr:hypothetical protein [Candidatus Contubernalis sp.]
MFNKKVISAIILCFLCFSFGCEEGLPSGGDFVNGEDINKFQMFLEDLKAMARELLYMAPRAVHDYNLKTIDNQIELYMLVEEQEPRAIGETGQSGTLVGDGYLKKNPVIPIGLRQDTGEWSEYRIGGNPLRVWPVGDWKGAYREVDQ